MMGNNLDLNTGDIVFKDATHKNFFLKYSKQCRYVDVYHLALIYCLGLSPDTRNNIHNIYDFKSGCVNPHCLKSGWQTSGTIRIIHLAFNLYCNGVPSVCDTDDTETQLAECKLYTVENIFCCPYALYFWQAIKIRYPEYCGG